MTNVDKALRSGRRQRIPQSKLPAASTRPWLVGHELSKRPAEVADRALPGHWEGDLVLGERHKTALITLVERTSRFTLIRRLPDDHGSTTVTDQLIEMAASIPAELRKTLTWDQGSEMAEHARFTMATDTKVFFCDPHSPWQRGSNENTNGLIRDFFPKGTDFATITDDQVAEAQYLLNIRPRQTLDWDTPAERLNQNHVALTP
ncbi:IS30 family transposase [Tessaracoccus lacteus]|uniref:IS30 family transposase n=1 Tax=Tessaracoccus lacteus TaxID=3041766 RepID=A0ABY8PZM5_9ACTN|nr:IS30 family transposase [Tessaracoccus sp. T21]WGT47701.1 IS30 family transposase [Tessaracoccus sp. T21]